MPCSVLSAVNFVSIQPMKHVYLLLVYLLLFNTNAIAQASADKKDIIRLPSSSSSIDNRFQYPEHILSMALEASVDKYGPFEIVRTTLRGTRDRMLAELQKGTMINVHNAPTTLTWEEKAIPVMFPIMKGLLNYRIFLIHKDNIDKFKQVDTLDDLKALTAGVGAQWSTTKALRKLGGFAIETGDSYEGLFGMLTSKRFDYLIRGMNEVFREYDERKEKFPQLMIEPYMLMELPLPWFFFVSPKHQRIAERIEYGLHKMKADGSFDREFDKYHGDNIKKANLPDRKLFRVKNLLLSPHKIYNDPSYWIDVNKVY